MSHRVAVALTALICSAGPAFADTSEAAASPGHALLIALAVFIIGIILAFATRRLKLGENATFIALFLTPLLVYGIASGMVKEITAPGGWGAKIQEVAQAKVATTLTKLAVQHLDFVAKEGDPKLEVLLSTAHKPIALTFQLGHGDYVLNIAKQFIQELLLIDPRMSVLVLDHDGSFVAMTEGITMLSVLEQAAEDQQPTLGQQIINAISSGNKDNLIGLPIFHAVFHVNTVTENDTNIMALEKMRLEDVQSIVVLGDNNRPIGIVRRDNIVAELLETLAAPDK